MSTQTMTADEIYTAAADANEAQYNTEVEAGDRRMRGENEYGGMLYRSYRAMVAGMVADWVGDSLGGATDDEILIGLAEAGWADGRIDAIDIRAALFDMRGSEADVVWYDLDPRAGELWVVAGPAGYDVADLDPDELPEGFRWVTDEEWAAKADGQVVVA